MDNLVFKTDRNDVLTNSLLVAHKFGKRHDNVIRAIDNLIKMEGPKLRGLYQSSTYVDAQGKDRPLMVMNKDGFTLLVMGFTGTDAVKFKIDYLEHFNRMEQALRDQLPAVPKTFSESLILAAKQQEEIEKQQKQLNYQKPIISFVENVFESDEKIDVGQAAKILEMPFGRNTLFKILREQGIFFKDKNEPLQKHVTANRFVVKQEWIERNGHSGLLTTKVLITQKGLAYLNHKLGHLKTIN